MGKYKPGDYGPKAVPRTAPAVEREYRFSIYNWRAILKEAETINAKTILVRLSLNPRILFLDENGELIKETPA